MNATTILAELVVDSFAGGGGASEGIRAAIGRDPDIAINHDEQALAMHRINHPGTRHVREDVWHVDPRALCGDRPIGLLWASPDCKHFSKAKGGKPRSKNIRGLAWVLVKWIRALPARQRPRVLILENVEEFRDWGPLLEDGKPCPLQRGATFKQWVAALRALGYAVEHRELRACDYGAPTIRKRLFLVARRDGRPIVWPEPTHGPPDHSEVLAGRRKPWRTAAEIIDWSLPCPSIFDSAEEIKAKHGVRAVRPLKEATLRRIAKGMMRYVVEAKRPFIVPITHRGDDRVHAADEPLRTITTVRRCELAAATVALAPFGTKFNTGSTGFPVEGPVPTVTAHASETRGGGAAPLGVVAPVLAHVAHGDSGGRREYPVDAPIGTVTAAKDHALVAGVLVPRYGERPGQEPRARSVEEPLATVVGTGNEASLAAVHLATMRNAQKPFFGADEPAHTLTAGGANAAVVAAFLAQHNTDMVGHDAREPVSTIVGKGCTQGLVAAQLSYLQGDPALGAGGDPREPLKTVLASGGHAALVAAFLAEYYGSAQDGQAADAPLGTVTTKPRHGLVTVTIDGRDFVVVDIGMRMLTARERFSAQGFRPDYVIDRGALEDGSVVELTAEAQGRMCGNSVCPPLAEALVRANYAPAAAQPVAPPAAMPLFAAE